MKSNKTFSFIKITFLSFHPASRLFFNPSFVSFKNYVSPGIILKVVVLCVKCKCALFH